MGCASSKSADAAVTVADVYRPPPTSVAVFDINTVEEPWLITTTTEDQKQEEYQNIEAIKKPNQIICLPILDKLESHNEQPPQLSWSEVSKALQDLKPSLEQQPTITTKAPPPKPAIKDVLGPAPAPAPAPALPELTGRRPVKENSFIIQDRMAKESNKAAEAATARWRRPNPLDGYPERLPPGNPDGVVLYTTTLRGVRRTFEDCEWARRIVYPNAGEAGVEVDERDVSLHGEFLKEVRELVGEEGVGGGVVPRLFVMGRYVGGIEEMVEVNESGKIRDMMRWVAKKKGGGVGEGVKGGWMGGCEGCGGARFVPCLECNGSCKVLGEDGKEVVRCGKCNENGLVLCPLCH